MTIAAVLPGRAGASPPDAGVAQSNASMPLAGGEGPTPTWKPSTKTCPALSAACALLAASWLAKRTLTKSSPGIPEYGGLWQWITSPNCVMAREMPTRLCWGMMPVVIRTSADIANHR
eukprot:CAMPEP_0172709932 /NCGR_PEP_ID=MMETSP1074-20121228/55357_1 /TAXON_ID=2916 /ORGANISM="Ceratium fusus, Strain PA161109" /LENGTH=117 /DNA_ID=CAMNT_0013533257 /DNA_START=611 /DNA_END=965 /DNA_ORIENTATION=-